VPLSVATIAGSPGHQGSGGGVGAAARFANPIGISGDVANLYIADSQANVLQKLQISSNTVTTLAGLAFASGPNDGQGASARFNSPALFWNDADYIYVPDLAGHIIRRVNLKTGEVMTLAGMWQESGLVNAPGPFARFSSPIAIWGNGSSLYIVDLGNAVLREFKVATGELTTIAGAPGRIGSTDGTGAAAQISGVIGIWGDKTHLYMADYGFHTIRRMDFATRTVTTLAGSPGNPGAVDDVGAAARFNQPASIWGNGTHLFVTEFGSHTIRRVEIATGRVTTVSGLAATPGTADGAAATARFNTPVGVWGNGSGLFITDTGNRTIRSIQPNIPAP
jgi:hypothetical protein